MRPKRSDSLIARSSRCFTPNSGSFRTVCMTFVWRALAVMGIVFAGCMELSPILGDGLMDQAAAISD